jgi:MOSC domain-containing protein YiiM
MPRVLSVNIALPRTVDHEGRSVRTGIFKQPVAGPVRVGPLHLDGDGQADLQVHGGPDKAVYAYDLSGYRYWRRELSRELPFGQFGENLTLEGMSETEVSIGDVLRAGTAVLQVTQPRAPCGKLAMKMGLPGFARQFLEGGRTGFYLRVLEEGEIAASDPIFIAEKDSRGLRVAEMTELMYRSPVDPERIRRALGIEALPGGLRRTLEKRLAGEN